MTRLCTLVPLVALVAAGCGGRPPAPPAAAPAPASAPEAATEGASAAVATPEPTSVGDTEIRERQVDEAPEIAEAAVTLLDDGRQRAIGGDLEAAKARFREAAAADPEFAEAHYNVGVIEEWQGNAGAARQAYEAALRARPDFGPAVVAIANLMIREGDGQGALAFARRQLERAPESNSLRNAVNAVRLALGQTDAVIRDTKEVLRRDEKNVAAMKNLARAYHQQGKHELAIAILTNARELAPEDPSLLGGIALAHLALGEKLKARLALEEAVKLPGGATAEIHNNLGLLYHEAGDYVGAEAQFRAALDRWPGMLQAQVNLANSLKGQQKFAEADQALQRALEIAPRSPDVLYNLAILYLDGQLPGVEPVARLEKALEYFRRYREVAPPPSGTDPVAEYIAEAQKRLEVEKKRAEQMRRMQKEAPASPDAEAAGATEGAEPASEDAPETPEAAPPSDSAEPPSGGDELVETGGEAR